MISQASDVPSYIAEVPAERRRAIEQLRRLCRTVLKGYKEGMDYGMPCYKRDEVVEVAFASQKQYIALYILKQDVVDEFRGTLTAASIGKSCIRFKKPESIDFGVVRRLLSRTVQSPAAPCA
ncbi:MAG: DUF1801 domain-containing protein [Terriglobia bacterium]|nr:MAG: DUF1801 domain-containing protein [Terriglobia bacterium]